jgi:hypothetical protein
LALTALFGFIGLNHSGYCLEGLSSGTVLATFENQAGYQTATFYQDFSFYGRQYTYRPSGQSECEIVNIEQFLDNDSVSSLRIGNGLLAILCNNWNCDFYDDWYNAVEIVGPYNSG